MRYAATSLPGGLELWVWSPLCSYALSGTDIGDAPMRSAILPYAMLLRALRFCLRLCSYALCGTNIRYAPTSTLGPGPLFGPNGSSGGGNGERGGGGEAGGILGTMLKQRFQKLGGGKRPEEEEMGVEGMKVGLPELCYMGCARRCPAMGLPGRVCAGGPRGGVEGEAGEINS
eukprot:2101511-Rhodomonas_salina.1